MKKYIKELNVYSGIKIKGIGTEVLPCTTDEFPRPVKRPKYSVLRNYILELTTGDITRDWKESLEEYLNHEKQ